MRSNRRWVLLVPDDVGSTLEEETNKLWIKKRDTLLSKLSRKNALRFIDTSSWLGTRWLPAIPFSYLLMFMVLLQLRSLMVTQNYARLLLPTNQLPDWDKHVLYQFLTRNQGDIRRERQTVLRPRKHVTSNTCLTVLRHSYLRPYDTT